MPNTITYQTEEQLQQKLAEALHTLHNLRFHQKYWSEHFGFEARRRKQHWEDKADQLLNGYGLTEHNNIKAVKVHRQ